MNNQGKKLISVLLAFVIILSLSVRSFAGDGVGINSAKKDYAELDEKIINYINAYIDIYGDENVKASSIKTAHDFSGNEYKIVECNPTGYFIIVPESGMLTEYSCTAVSPYALYDDAELFYAGPTYYYVHLTNQSSDDLYVHTIETENCITKSMANDISIKCEEIYDEYQTMISPIAVTYFAGDISDNDLLAALENENGDNPSPLYMPNTNWFINHSSGFGYIGGGCCGYIAANLLLKYWDDSAAAIALPSAHAIINSTTLTYTLKNIGNSLGYGNSTYASYLKNIVNQYLDTYNLPGNATYALFAYNVYNELNNNRPVVLYGSLYDPENPSSNTNHAVVAYSYYYASDGYLTFRCHYGWDGYANISVSSSNSTIGEHMRYNPYN